MNMNDTVRVGSRVTLYILIIETNGFSGNSKYTIIHVYKQKN